MISCWVDIDLSWFDIEYSSILYWIDIECSYLRYRYFPVLEHSISNSKTFDIACNIVSRYRRSFTNARYRTLQLQYRNIPISKVRHSISKVGKVPDSEHVQKWVCTYKLHHFRNSLKAVCTEYILTSVHWTESVPAAYSKSIKAFIPIITLSILHPCPLQEGPLAAPGGSASCTSAPAALAALASAAARPRRPRWPPLQHSTLLPNRGSIERTSPTVLTIHRAAMDLSW